MRPARSLAVLFVLGVFTGALAGCGPAAPTPTVSPAATATAPAPSLPAPSTPDAGEPSASVVASSPTPASGEVVTAEGWHQVEAQPALDSVQLQLLVWTGSRFVAAGTGLDGSAVFLDSPDGLAWHVQPARDADFMIHGLAVGPAGLVAVGSVEAAARSWSSPDGLTWTASPDGAALQPTGDDSVVMASVTPRDGGWLAVGSEDPPCTIDCGGAPVRALVWISTDGRHWSRQPSGPTFLHAAMSGVVRGGPGFVAVGDAPDLVPRTATERSATHAVVWTSVDGRAWSRVPDAPLFHAPAGTDQTFGVTMTAIAAAGDRLVAVGTVGTQDAVGSALAWWSTDGRRWSRGTGERFPYGQLFEVAAIPGGFVATGPSGADSCLGGIWTSTDGRSWACDAADPLFDGFAAYAGAASPTREVVVGLGDTTAGLGTTAWVRDLP